MAHDVETFNTFYLEHILSFPSLARTTAHVSMSRVKYTTALPIARHTRELH